jgi:hypothetical protein
MPVQLSRSYAAIAEIASHKRSFLLYGIFGFEVTAFRLEDVQKGKRGSDVPQKAIV